MPLLISDAWAANSTASGDSVYSLMMVAMIFALFYFMIIRPQTQKTKAQRNLIAALKKGDEVLLSSGMLGKIIAIDEQYIKVNLAEGCDVLMQLQAVSAILPKGTVKSITKLH